MTFDHMATGFVRRRLSATADVAICSIALATAPIWLGRRARDYWRRIAYDWTAAGRVPVVNVDDADVAVGQGGDSEYASKLGGTGASSIVAGRSIVGSGR